MVKIVTDEIMEVYLHDFKPEAQDAILAFLGLKDASEGNYDVIPFHIVEKP